METLIELRQVRKEFGRLMAVDQLDLEVRRGEIFGLLGHNGAGKSTAIGMMLGQVWPTAGTVRLFGHEVTAHRRLALAKVGAIFESPVFYEYLSGRRNLEILSHYSGGTTKQKIDEVIQWVGLTGREQAPVRTYSHGMRARLAIGQALLPAPELLILDEPSDGLDPEGIHEMRHTILRLHRELGLSILLSSHLLTEVEQLGTRIAVLHRGRKVYDGALTQALESRQWYRLRTADHDGAIQRLREAGLIAETREDGHLALSPNTGSEQVVKFLVEKDFPVYEFAREERTLENFYLTLMQKERGRTAPVTP